MVISCVAHLYVQTHLGYLGSCKRGDPGSTAVSEASALRLWVGGSGYRQSWRTGNIAAGVNCQLEGLVGQWIVLQ